MVGADAQAHRSLLARSLTPVPRSPLLPNVFCSSAASNADIYDEFCQKSAERAAKRTVSTAHTAAAGQPGQRGRSSSVAAEARTWRRASGSPAQLISLPSPPPPCTCLLLQVGDPFVEGTEQGPQIDEDQLNKVSKRLLHAAAGFVCGSTVQRRGPGTRRPVSHGWCCPHSLAFVYPVIHHIHADLVTCRSWDTWRLGSARAPSCCAAASATAPRATL